jgi:signal transduction histidine kinase
VRGLAQLARQLRTSEEIPVLVLRVPALEQIAWREGRAVARNLERSCLRSFIETGGKVLRGTDILAHDEESELFVAALVTMPRGSRCVAMPTDCRATLARLAAAMERASGVEIQTGWTVARDVAADPEFIATAAAALERGARERERYTFFSTIGHELRTPLTSIRGYLETLLFEEDLDAREARRFLEIARAEAVRLGRLVDGMFDLSLLDLNGASAGGEVCVVKTAVLRARDAVAGSAAARGVSVEQLACGEHCVALGEDRLVQVLINLLDNAIKHGKQDGHIFVSSRALDERYLEIRVDDDGPGVAPAEREAIFILAGRGTTTAPGTGIGLAIVRLIVDRAGGEIDVVASRLGGAQFRLRLPVARAERPEADVRSGRWEAQTLLP